MATKVHRYELTTNIDKKVDNLFRTLGDCGSDFCEHLQNRIRKQQPKQVINAYSTQSTYDASCRSANGTAQKRNRQVYKHLKIVDYRNRDNKTPPVSLFAGDLTYQLLFMSQFSVIVSAIEDIASFNAVAEYSGPIATKLPMASTAARSLHVAT